MKNPKNLCETCLNGLHFKPLQQKYLGHSYSETQYAIFCKVTNRRVTRFKTTCKTFSNSRLDKFIQKPLSPIMQYMKDQQERKEFAHQSFC